MFIFNICIAVGSFFVGFQNYAYFNALVVLGFLVDALIFESWVPFGRTYMCMAYSFCIMSIDYLIFCYPIFGTFRVVENSRVANFLFFNFFSIGQLAVYEAIQNCKREIQKRKIWDKNYKTLLAQLPSIQTEQINAG